MLKGRNKKTLSGLALFIILYGYIHGDKTLKGRNASIHTNTGEAPFTQQGEREGQGEAQGMPRGKGNRQEAGIQGLLLLLFILQ